MATTAGRSQDDFRTTQAQAQELVGDLMARRRWIYWVDFGACSVLLWALLVLGGWQVSWWSLVAFAPASVLIFRLGTFIHEIQHFRRGEFRSFVVVWNVLFAGPNALPHPVYDYHRIHHSVNGYGTPADAEYADFPRPFPRKALPMMVVRSLMVPGLFIARFTVGTLALVHRPTRDKFERKLSELHMDLSRSTEPWTPQERRRWLPYELTVLAWYVAGLVLLVTGTVPLWFFVYFYLVMAGGIFLNQVRFLLAHGYQTRPEARSFEAQLADSYDHPSHLAFLWAPTGLAYHATHHWFPRMPYHALGRAHRRLLADPDLSPVMARSTGPAGLLPSLKEFLERGPDETPVGGTPVDGASVGQPGGLAPVSPE